MILSMTGFATSTVEIPLSSNKENITLAISIKSLNSRFFEMNCKIPSLLSNLEVPLQRLLKKQLHRGHVSLHIKIIDSASLQESINPSLPIIQNYLTAINTIQTKFNLQDQVTLSQILQLPNVLQHQELQLGTTVEKAILQSVHQVSLELIKAQKEEGLQLENDIKNQLASMKVKITQIKDHSEQIIKDKKISLTKVITDLSVYDKNEETKTTEQSLLEIKKANLMHEIEKVDINEETVRFNSHLDNVSLQFKSDNPVKGKKLDFIIQELNREINTIAAKCSNIMISSLAIDIKSELEKAREQAQNII